MTGYRRVSNLQHGVQFTDADLAALRRVVRQAARASQQCSPMSALLMQALIDRLERAEELNRQLARQCEKFADRRLAQVFAGERR